MHHILPVTVLCCTEGLGIKGLFHFFKILEPSDFMIFGSVSVFFEHMYFFVFYAGTPF